MNNAAKILITPATLFYGIVPLIADLNPSHLFHADWTPHSKVHMAWLLAINSSIASFPLFLLWKRNEVIIAGLLGVCVIGGFWVAALTSQFYGGALADVGGIDRQILGLEGNALAFGILFVMLVTGLALKLKAVNV